MKAPTYPGKTRRSRQQWQKLIDQCEQAGQSATGFCEQRDLPYQSFLQWRTRLKEDDKISSARFLEIVPEAEVSTNKPEANSWAVELSLGNNIVLRIRQSS